MSKPTLQEQLGVEPIRSRVIPECVGLIDGQVKSKSGLSGIALKGAYGAIKTIKRGFVTGVVEALLDDWLTELQPYYTKWDEAGSGAFSDYLVSRSDDVSEDLLKVTDARAETTKHKTAKKYYFKMRGKAKDNVVEALPDLARLLEQHLNASDEAASGNVSDDAASA